MKLRVIHTQVNLTINKLYTFTNVIRTGVDSINVKQMLN